MSSVPLPVILISDKQIQQTGVVRLNEILNEQTGIVLTNDITVGRDGVQIQGIASDYVLVLIDGVPVVGRSSGNLDLSRLAVGNVQQVEIVKGPSSSLYGSEALGGVINIITQEPRSEKISGQVAHRAASFNEQNTTVNLQEKNKAISYSLFLDRLSTDGYDLAPTTEGQTVNPFESYTFNGRVYWAASKKLDLFASGRYFTREFDAAPSASEEEDLNLLLRADHQPSMRSNFQYELYYTNYNTDELAIDPISDEVLFENDFNQKLLRPEVRFNYKFKEFNTMTVGAGYNFENLERALFADDVSFDSQYIFAQYDFNPLTELNIILGARFDNHSEYNSQLSPKISARYQINTYLAVKGSVGSGFKAPDFRQLYLDFTNTAVGYTVLGKQVEAQGIQRLIDNGEIANLIVDPSELGGDLNAESSVGYNVGLTYNRGDLSSEINFFRNDIKNLIDTRILARKNSGQNVFGYINRERIYTQGIELDVKYRLLENLDLSTGYQLLFAYDKDKREAVKNGEVFARDPDTQQSIQLTTSDHVGLENRSRHLLNFKVFYEVPKWKANANVRAIYRSEFGLTDTNGNDLLDVYDTSFIDGYTIVNLTLGKKLYEYFDLQAGANNLLDFRGSNPLAGQEDEVFINPGIQLFIRLSINF